ncbi:SOS response-associated peptidase [Rhodobacter ferrooxidans]|uniref:Abasic site processing protein n=1 Tax=Rhodobacter ferrooxidans TaxID=371731 RepID=C8RYD5_9RHOB|nr:SOS response-associated peptidase family protein [Rhodobacter sp. SW2]EEW26123.1 protein of unknown function DUF159 [Rhodobacter sp. SW2]
MCGRFTMTHPDTAMAQLFDAVLGNDLPPVPRFNICPTQPVAVVTADGGRRLRAMRWGFLPVWYDTPSGGPLLINARADTVAVKPAFREAVRARRCLVPASGFYEWSAGKDGARLPWYVTRSDGGVMAFAAIWQSWERGGVAMDTCALITTEAGPDMAAIHHRQPVLVPPADWPLWLGEAGHGAAVLMQAGAAGELRAHRVGMAVNSNRAVGPELIEPLIQPLA